MKQTRIFVVLAVVLLFDAKPAYAFQTANELYHNCKSDEDATNTVCIAYIQGAWNGMLSGY